MSSVSDKIKFWAKRGLFRSSSETVVTRGGDRERSRDRDSISRFGRYTKSQQSDSSGVATILAESQDEHEDKDAGTEKDFRNMQIQKNGALNQCINELTSNRRLSLGDSEKNINKQDSTSAAESSHFVTVIEVKESKDAQENENSSSQKIVQQMSTSSGGGDSSESEATVSMGSFERKHSATAIEPTAPPMSPSNSTSVIASASGSPSISALQPSGTNLEGKKKVPPRPPPKVVKRVEPPTIPIAVQSKRELSSSTSESPSSSLEHNIKPSDILRQKSHDALDAKSLAANRKTTPDLSKSSKSSEVAEELGRIIGKSESLEKNKRPGDAMKINQSPTGSLGKTVSALGASPTGSLSKFSSARHGTDSPTGSLGKMDKKGNDSTLQSVGSKESLASQGYISEIIKSYESISSLSSDSMKTSQTAENEPYYDTVPNDNDGEYVYIKAGGNGSTSSRDDLSTTGSTLPMPAIHRSHMSSQTSVLEPESPGRSSNYVNIDYFIHQSNEQRSSSIDSDGEMDAPPIMRTISQDDHANTPGALRKISSSLRGGKIRSILDSIIKSEKLYVECLNKMVQYKRAIHATLDTSQPVIKEEEENTIFFKIDELYAAHTDFLSLLKQKASQESGDILVGDAFKRLADMIDLYSSFLHNYGQAIETIKKCSANNPQFKDIASTIKLNLHNEQSLTLEDLLHKPVARVQINALVFNDLLNETPTMHPDYQPLRQAQKTIHVFLKQLNVVPCESNRNLRRMVKNSFIVELVDGHRKLRHLFLFNDAIACAKYKASGRDRFELELKWFIPLKDILIFEEDSTADLKESSPANILQLKSQACTVRDQILLEEKDEKKAKANGLRLGDKHRRKLADLEAQLVLASPNLVFRIGNKAANNKNLTFFLSSEFERTQWIESIISLQQSCNIHSSNTVNSLEIQAFILAMQGRIKSEMGSYLMRNRNDESLLVGDLHLTVQGLTGLEQPADMYICIEVDSYGHYFRKAKTKMVCRSTSPLWNESFVLELEGSQNVRILLYESHERPILKAKHILKLSRSWLQEAPFNKPIKMTETITLNTTLRFVPGEVTLRRVPTSKPGALFGAKMNQVLKREKRDIPFIISACIREVERRGMAEVGIYRVSGSASDLAKLKKSFESNAYEAEQLLKEVDIHSVTGILKSYLRELPEALFTDMYYPKLFETFNQFSTINETARIKALLEIFEELPQPNKATINHILDHLIRVHQQEAENKMSLHNLAMVFGPTLLRPGQTNTKQKDLLASSTVDVMAQAGILYCFLQSRLKRD